MKNILLFLIIIPSLFFFFLGPLMSYLTSRRATEIADKVRLIERELSICEKFMSKEDANEGNKDHKTTGSKNYHSSINPEFLECLHNAVYNPTPKATGTK